MGIDHSNGRYATVGRVGASFDEEIWSLKIVLAKTGLSRSTLYTYIAARTFPMQRRLGKRRVAWFALEVNAWIASRPLAGMDTLSRDSDEGAGLGSRSANHRKWERSRLGFH